LSSKFLTACSNIKKNKYTKDWLQFTKYLIYSPITETQTLSNGISKMNPRIIWRFIKICLITQKHNINQIQFKTITEILKAKIWNQHIIIHYLSLLFFFSKLQMNLVSFEPSTSPSTSFLKGEEFSSLAPSFTIFS